MTATGTELYSFGELLTAFRKRRRLTQQQLAEKIGVHRSAIVRWEQGDFLPQSKTLVLELAQHLHLDEQESRHLLEASLTALSPYWYVPLPRNPFFTGREEILEALHRQLGSEQAVALTQSSALYGLGGVGKTQIALEYAYRHALEYSAVFWIAAETEESIISNLLRIAEVLQLPERDEKEQQRVIAAVQRWLTTHGQWLLIWDNVEDLTLLDRFLPAARQGVVLITTRCRTLGTFARGVDLLPMEQEEGILFLLRRAKVLSPDAASEQVCQLAGSMPAQYTAAAELVEAMGGLPLALDQAGAYIEETQCSLPAYLKLFQSQCAALLQQRGTGSRDHPAPVSTTFALAIAAISKRHPAVGDLLRVCALLQPDAIPEELFRQGSELLGTTLKAACRDELEWNRLVAITCSYSLLARQPAEQFLSMHRLVQAVLLDTMTEEEWKQWTCRVLDALDVVFPSAILSTAFTNWQQCHRLLPHALHCLHQAGITEETLALASLAYKTAHYLHERGQYAEAEPLFQRTCTVREHILGQNHPEVAVSLNHLALLYWKQGRYAQAESLYKRALVIWEQAYGPDHPDVVRPLNNLAILYWEQGRYMQAEPLYERALAIWEQIYGPDHLPLASLLNNLANLYSVEGKYAEAEPYHQRALSIWKQAYGPDHPLVATSLHNLALLFQRQGNYGQAGPLFQDALRIREKKLGPEHPETAEVLNGLAELCREQGNHTEAEALFQSALRIREQALGLDHPEIAETLNGLANLCREQGNYTEAEVLYQRAYSLREHYRGQQHPDTAQTLHDLALLQQKQGRLDEALSLVKRSLSIRSQSLGNSHPKTIASQTLYAQLLQQPACVLEEAVSSQKFFDDPMQEFLEVCCELHPLAWCRIRDLWQTYEQWTASCQGRVPLSRRAFATQVKAQGCRVDRTSKARIWRGIRLRHKSQ